MASRPGHGGDVILAGRQAGDAELAEVVGLASAGRRNEPQVRGSGRGLR